MATRRPAPPRTSHAFTSVAMDTGINIQIVTTRARDQVEKDVQRALAWFDTVERICTRFDPSSEVMQLLERAGEPVKVSTLLFEAVAFAVDLARQTAGAFDPTIGAHIDAERRQRREDVGRRKRPKERAFESAEEKERQEHERDHERRVNDGTAHFERRIEDHLKCRQGVPRRPVQPDAPNDVFDVDDRVVDEFS